eukprot:m.157337 g.157337  ORF g.157337 m.157337 type:complete len:460 (+) comp38709_c0_seq17:2522-3901(+)
MFLMTRKKACLNKNVPRSHPNSSIKVTVDKVLVVLGLLVVMTHVVESNPILKRCHEILGGSTFSVVATADQMDVSADHFSIDCVLTEDRETASEKSHQSVKVKWRKNGYGLSINSGSKFTTECLSFENGTDGALVGEKLSAWGPPDAGVYDCIVTVGNKTYVSNEVPIKIDKPLGILVPLSENVILDCSFKNKIENVTCNNQGDHTCVSFLLDSTKVEKKYTIIVITSISLNKTPEKVFITFQFCSPPPNITIVCGNDVETFIVTSQNNTLWFEWTKETFTKYCKGEFSCSYNGRPVKLGHFCHEKTTKAPENSEKSSIIAATVSVAGIIVIGLSMLACWKLQCLHCSNGASAEQNPQSQDDNSSGYSQPQVDSSAYPSTSPRAPATELNQENQNERCSGDSYSQPHVDSSASTSTSPTAAATAEQNPGSQNERVLRHSYPQAHADCSANPTKLQSLLT